MRDGDVSHIGGARTRSGMKKLQRPSKPLTLSRETIAQLDRRDLTAVAGGRWATNLITCTC